MAVAVQVRIYTWKKGHVQFEHRGNIDSQNRPNAHLAVIQHHEQDDDEQTDLAGEHGARHGVLTERRVDVLFLQHGQLHRQRPGVPRPELSGVGS